MARPRGHGRILSFYEVSRTPLFAARYDPRFSYCLYVPDSYDEDGTDVFSLFVVVHGTARTATEYRDAFIDFAEENRCFVLAPLFPAGITGRYECDSYKFLERDGVRFDLALLDMVDEVTEKYRVDASRFLLYGFSGGGQFAHRFLYLHPRRLKAVGVGAPGVITLIDESRPWWVGLGDVKERFGTTVSIEDVRKVPVLLFIGRDDVETWDINDPSSVNWMEGAYDTGTTRVARLEALRKNYESVGIKVTHVMVPNMAHEGLRELGPIKEFFANILVEEAR